MAFTIFDQDHKDPIQMSFPTIRNAQVPCAILVGLVGMAHIPPVKWGQYADPATNIPQVGHDWCRTIGVNPPAPPDVTPSSNIMDMNDNALTCQSAMGQTLCVEDNNAHGSDMDNHIDDCKIGFTASDTETCQEEDITNGGIHDRPRRPSSPMVRFTDHKRCRNVTTRSICVIVKRPRCPPINLDSRSKVNSLRPHSNYNGMDSPQLSPLRSTVVLCNSVLCPTSIDRGSGGTISSIPDLDNPVDEQNGGSLHDPTDNPSLEATTQYGVPADENIQTQSFRDHYMSQKSDVTFYDLDYDTFCNILKNEMGPPIVECRYGEPFLLAKSRNGVLFRCQELWKIFGDSFGVSLLASNSPNLIQFVPNRCGGSPILDQLIQRLKIERVALFVTRLTSNEPHVHDFLQIARTHGYHTHIEHNMSISGYKNGHELLETIIGWAIETWSQGWSFIVVLDATSVLPKELLSIIRNLRKHCDDETMDVVVCGSNHWATDRFITAGANAVLKDADGKSTEFFFQKLRERAPPERIDFYERGAPFYEFTNFFEARFSVGGLDWKTSEHYFQANKFPDHRNIYNEVRRADSPRTAFNLSRRHEEKKRHDWELLKFDTGFPIKEDVMHMGLWHKFDKNPQLRNKLLSTGKARLFEHTRNDLYWGDGLDGSGKNRLGLLLERVRLELFEQEIRTLAAAGHVTKTANVRACWYMNDLKKILTDMG